MQQSQRWYKLTAKTHRRYDLKAIPVVWIIYYVIDFIIICIVSDLDEQYDLYKRSERLLDMEAVDKFEPQLSQIFQLYESYKVEKEFGAPMIDKKKQLNAAITSHSVTWVTNILFTRIQHGYSIKIILSK